MKTYTQLIEELSMHFDEDVAANFAAGGGISGMGYNIGKPNQPQVAGRDADDLAIKPRKKKIRETFAGCPVFTVTSEDYSRCVNGRTKYERWSRKLNMEEMNNQDIRTYAHRNPNSAIIIKDEKSGIMSYLIPPTKEK